MMLLSISKVLWSVLAAVLAVGVGVLVMSVRIIIKKNGTFHSEDVGQSQAMREKGVYCTRAQDRIAQRGNPLKLDVDAL